MNKVINKESYGSILRKLVTIIGNPSIELEDIVLTYNQIIKKVKGSEDMLKTSETLTYHLYGPTKMIMSKNSENLNTNPPDNMFIAFTKSIDNKDGEQVRYYVVVKARLISKGHGSKYKISSDSLFKIIEVESPTAKPKGYYAKEIVLQENIEIKNAVNLILNEVKKDIRKDNVM